MNNHLLRMIVLDTDEFKFCGAVEETPVRLVTECFGEPKEGVFWQETCRFEEFASLKPSQLLDSIKFLELVEDVVRTALLWGTIDPKFIVKCNYNSYYIIKTMKSQSIPD